MKIYGLILSFFISIPIWGLDPLEYRMSDLVSYLGYTPQQIWQEMGPPHTIQAVIGDSEYPVASTGYSQGITFYWYDNRIWQIRLDGRWNRDFWGLNMAMTGEGIKLILGRAFLESEDLLLYQFPDVGFPVEGRFYLDPQGQIEEFFFYRSDF